MLQQYALENYADGSQNDGRNSAAAAGERNNSRSRVSSDRSTGAGGSSNVEIMSASKERKRKPVTQESDGDLHEENAAKVVEGQPIAAQQQQHQGLINNKSAENSSQAAVMDQSTPVQSTVKELS